MIKNKKVLLTGASSGIGKAIAIKLAKEGFKVYGIGRSFVDELPEEFRKNFVPVVFDLMNTSEIPALIKKLEADDEFDILINNAGVAYYGTHETLLPEHIHEMTVVNLEVPMLLSNLLLKNFKASNKKNSLQNQTDTTENTCHFIINISSVTAFGTNTHGCAYGATKAGLSSFGKSLFEEARKYGIKVVNIHPDMTETKLYRNANFTTDADRAAYLDADDVATAVWNVITSPEHLVITDITIRPQKHRIVKKG